MPHFIQRPILLRLWQVLGRALKDLPRDEIVVATKVGRYGPEDFDFSKEKVTSSVRESLQRLQVCLVPPSQTLPDSASSS